MGKDKTIDIEQNQSELLQALSGFPYFIVVQNTIETKGSARGRVSNNFDYDHLFGMIKLIARNDAKFKEKLVDYIIDLSKEV